MGDSGLLIGYSKDPKNNVPWQARKLTRDHKPEDPIELKRIESMGGSVAAKSGVNRVVWNRPILNPNKLKSSQTNGNMVNSNSAPYDLDHYKSRPVQIQTERIPFLAVARSLGDLWSYDINKDEFIVSPVPDVFHFDLDPTVHKCLILGKLRPNEVNSNMLLSENVRRYVEKNVRFFSIPIFFWKVAKILILIWSKVYTIYRVYTRYRVYT